MLRLRGRVARGGQHAVMRELLEGRHFPPREQTRSDAAGGGGRGSHLRSGSMGWRGRSRHSIGRYL